MTCGNDFDRVIRITLSHYKRVWHERKLHSIRPKDTSIVTSQKVKLGNSETMTQLVFFFFAFLREDLHVTLKLLCSFKF